MLREDCYYFYILGHCYLEAFFSSVTNVLKSPLDSLESIFNNTDFSFN